MRAPRPSPQQALAAVAKQEAPAEQVRLEHAAARRPLMTGAQPRLALGARASQAVLLMRAASVMSICYNHSVGAELIFYYASRPVHAHNPPRVRFGMVLNSAYTSPLPRYL